MAPLKCSEGGPPIWSSGPRKIRWFSSVTFAYVHYCTCVSISIYIYIFSDRLVHYWIILTASRLLYVYIHIHRRKAWTYETLQQLSLMISPFASAPFASDTLKKSKEKSGESELGAVSMGKCSVWWFEPSKGNPSNNVWAEIYLGLNPRAKKRILDFS